MNTMFFFATVGLSAACIYLFWSNQKLNSRLSQNELEIGRINISLNNDLERINEKLQDFDALLNGETNSSGDGIKYGGLYGVYGSVGRIDYESKRLSSLIFVINQKFVDLGRKLDVHELVYTDSIDRQVEKYQFESLRDR